MWGRLAKNRDECVAIDWLHKAYQKGIVRGEQDKSIKRTSVTGELGQIGRLWHRMYPPKRLFTKKSASAKSTRSKVAPLKNAVFRFPRTKETPLKIVPSR